MLVLHYARKFQPCIVVASHKKTIIKQFLYAISTFSSLIAKSGYLKLHCLQKTTLEAIKKTESFLACYKSCMDYKDCTFLKAVP